MLLSSKEGMEVEVDRSKLRSLQKWLSTLNLTNALIE